MYAKVFMERNVMVPATQMVQGEKKKKDKQTWQNIKNQEIQGENRPIFIVLFLKFFSRFVIKSGGKILKILTQRIQKRIM